MTVEMSVEYSGGTGLRGFKALATVVKWADLAGVEIREALKDKAPVGTGSGAGRLRDSIRFERATTGSGVTVTFTANVPYARFVIEGTKPHIIEAKAARALHWSSQGGEHFAMRVHHPGTRPNNFVERAISPLEAAIRHELVLMLERDLGA